MTSSIRSKPYLSENDTYDIYQDARCFEGKWLKFGNERSSRSGPRSVNIICWEADAQEQNTGRSGTLDHECVVDAMIRIAEGKTNADAVTAAQVRTVLSATSNENAMEKLCDLDSYNHDLILQVAFMGEVVYQ